MTCESTTREMDTVDRFTVMRVLLSLLIVVILLACENGSPVTSEGEPEAKLVFVMLDSTVGPPGMYTMNLDGSELAPIAVVGDSIRKTDGSYLVIPESTGCENPRWSPDGQKVACGYSHGPHMSTLVLMNADGTNKHFLPRIAGYQPQWSPQGDRLLFARAAWSSIAGPAIVDTSGENDRDFKIAGDPPRIFEEDTVWFHGDYQWGSTGKEIYGIASVNVRPTSYGTPLENEIFSLDSEAGTIIERMTHNHINEGGFRLSPDGRYVAFRRGKYGQPNNFFVLSLKDGELTEIPIDNTVNFFWNWSSDSKKIVFAKDEDPDPYSNQDYYLYMVDIKEPTEIVKLTSFQAFMPDLFISTVK